MSGGASGSGGEGGGGATNVGTTAEPTVAFVVAITLTPRLNEMAVAGWATRAVAAAATAAAVLEGTVLAEEEPPAALDGGTSGMVRMAAMVTLPASTRSVR